MEWFLFIFSILWIVAGSFYILYTQKSRHPGKQRYGDRLLCRGRNVIHKDNGDGHFSPVDGSD